jgi:shikimate kinase
MIQDSSNIVLIGMPGSGKSTVGIILAKMMSRSFVDTDILIQTKQRRPLQEIIDAEGHMELRRIEEEILLDMRCVNHVIATGGSAVYSHVAMKHLKSDGTAVFLKADIGALRSRIHNFETRGLAKRPDQSFADLFAERSALYTRYADITIECSDTSQEAVCGKIMAHLERKVKTGLSGL